VSQIDFESSNGIARYIQYLNYLSVCLRWWNKQDFFLEKNAMMIDMVTHTWEWNEPSELSCRIPICEYSCV